MSSTKKKKFYKARAIGNRLPGAPEMMTLPEVAFYTGAALITVKKWPLEWEAQNLIGQNKLAFQVAGPGSPWTVRRAPFVAWLIAAKNVRPGPEYGYASREAAIAVLDALTEVQL